MSYKVIYASHASERQFTKFVSKLPQDLRDKILDAVLGLSKNPRPYGTTKLTPPAKVFSYVAYQRIRVEDYRVFYDVDDARQRVIIYGIKKRDERTYR